MCNLLKKKKKPETVKTTKLIDSEYWHDDDKEYTLASSAITEAE